MESELEPLLAEQGKSSNLSSMFHIICVIAGAGLLQVPFAISQSGWAGVFLLIFAAWVNHYSGALLNECLYYEGSRINGGYPEIGKVLYGKPGQILVTIFYNCALLGTTCLYLIITGMSLEEMVGFFTKTEWIQLAGIFLLLPYLLFRTLKEVAFASLTGVMASAFIVIAIVITTAQDYSADNQHVWFRPSTFGTVMGTFAFSYGGNYVYPEVELNMSTPKDFKKVLKWAMFGITSMYIVAGVAGYATYGDQTVSPITLNLPNGIGRQLCNSVIVVHVMLACPVLLTTFALDVERTYGFKLGPETSKQFLQRILLRTSILAGLVIISCSFPYFADVMTLIGAIANMLLIFIFPVVFHWRMYGMHSNFSAAIAAVILITGLVGGTLGAMDALQNLIKAIKG
jgi:amino acid permease